VVGLRKAPLQTRADEGLPEKSSDKPIELLDAVQETSGMPLPHPELPMEDAKRSQPERDRLGDGPSAPQPDPNADSITH
jgi:hypothetical protein